MSNATPTLRAFAGSLIRHEAQVNPAIPAAEPTVFPVTEKMRSIIATYIGRSGYHALIYRSLVLAWDEVPWLRHVEIDASGSLFNFTDLSTSQDSAKAFDGSEVLLARLVELLLAFIGETLTLRLLHGLWPAVLDDPEFIPDILHEPSN